ncbi:cupin domain-containing protein [Bacteroidota bacterium]
MLKRFYKEGQKLDVAGLNEITVLIDRSETEFTETGWNCWSPNQDGPPHKHNDKDQVFYVTGGVGKIVLGDKTYDAKPGCLAYVPAGIVHQSITTTAERLCYILFNVFRSTSKEGHASFAEHIEKVKQIRRAQADSGNVEADKEEVLDDIKDSKYYEDITSGKTFDFGSNTATLLVDRKDANRTEVTCVTWRDGKRGAMVAHKDKEQTFFVLEGKGKITVGDETEMVGEGDMVFVPRNTPHTTEAVDGDLKYLCMNGLAEDVKDNSFGEMYKRVSADRISRFENKSNDVGE